MWHCRVENFLSVYIEFVFSIKVNVFKLLRIGKIRLKEPMSSRSVTVRGKIREIGSDKLAEIFEKNPYMAEIYPDEKSRTVLTVFQIYEGEGEFFDLSQHTIFRESFVFGGAKIQSGGFFVRDRCIGCKLCYSVCPQKCIDITQKPVVIAQEHCLHCGRCSDICPVRAIEKISE